MRKEPRSQGSAIHVGISSILIIFIILCLVTFATLSFLSARADVGFCQKSAEQVTAYYKANNLAEEKLAELDILLQSVWNTQTEKTLTPDPVLYQNALLQAEYPANISVFEADNSSVQLLFQIPATETQALQVKLLASLPRQGEPFYQIQSWKLIKITEWLPDDQPNLWGGVH